MKSERTGGGDPRDAVKLLWRNEVDQPRRRGPAPAHSVDEMVEKAIGIADREGLAAVTMRKLADSVGMAPMNIYRYVPSRAVLVDLMFDQVCTTARMGGLENSSLDQALLAIAESNRDLYTRHPWAAEVGTARPSVGPGQTRKYESELAVLAEWKLGDVETDAALALVIGFVRSNFRESIEQETAIAESGVSDEEWWRANEPLLEELVNPEDFPLATRIGQAAGEAHGSSADPGYSYRFGIERIVTGIVALAKSD